MKRLGPALGIAALVLVPSFLFLGRYTIDGTGTAPVGSDTPQHVWRSEVVARLGLDALPSYEGDAHALNTNADRPGLPLVLAALSAVTGAGSRELIYVFPAVVAAAIASATAALAGAIPRVPWWGLVLTGLVTGTSIQVVLAANGYLDQLLVEPLVLAAAAGALGAAAGGPGRALCAVCLAAAFLVHWQFAALFAGLLGLLALACLPESLTDRRGSSFLDTPSGRVAVALGAGVGVGIGALLLGAPGAPRPPIGLVRGRSADREQARLYRLPATAAAAIVGAVSLLLPRGEPGRRRAAWLLVPWALMPAAAALLYAAGRTVPVQRSLSFDLAIPILGALGAVAVVEWARDRAGRLAGAMAIVLAAAALLASVFFGWDVWRSRSPWSDDRRLAEFHAIAQYLSEAGRPAVLVVGATAEGSVRANGRFGTVPVLRRIRAELPPRLALGTTIYLGDPDQLAEGRPTLRPEVPDFDEVSRATWRAVRPVLTQDPIIVVVRARFDGFADAVRDHPEWMTTPWMAVISGPAPSSELAIASARPSPASLGLWWAVSIGVISFAGAGWAGRLGGGPLALRMAMAPAIGLAAVTVVGVLVERLGVRMGGAGGIATLIIVALAGAAAAASRPPRERAATSDVR